MKRLLPWIAFGTAACACAQAQMAQQAARIPGPPADVSRQIVEQKQALVKRMLADSAAAKRIAASTDSAAGQRLAAANESYRKAAVSLAANDLTAANGHLDAATRLIGKARQLAPDPRARELEQRERYAQLLRSVESLRLYYQSHLRRAKGYPQDAVVSDAQIVRVTRLVDRAKDFASAGQIASANKALGEAESALTTSLGRALRARTVEYAKRFDTLAEEYDYELERNASYAELIPIALAEFAPAGDAVREVQQSLQANRVLREQAHRLAADKDHQAALAALRGGTALLQNALATAGLRVPQEQESR